MGASFDYEIIGVKEDVTPEDNVLQEMYRNNGAGILEIKNVDYLAFKNGWLLHDDGIDGSSQSVRRYYRGGSVDVVDGGAHGGDGANARIAAHRWLSGCAECHDHAFIKEWKRTDF